MHVCTDRCVLLMDWRLALRTTVETIMKHILKPFLLSLNLHHQLNWMVHGHVRVCVRITPTCSKRIFSAEVALGGESTSVKMGLLTLALTMKMRSSA